MHRRGEATHGTPPSTSRDFTTTPPSPHSCTEEAKLLTAHLLLQAGTSPPHHHPHTHAQKRRSYSRHTSFYKQGLHHHTTIPTLMHRRGEATHGTPPSTSRDFTTTP